MKRLLFTCGSMSVGGIQKSLLALLDKVEYRDFKVDLMVPDFSGDLLQEVPSCVNIIKAPDIVTKPTFSKTNLRDEISFVLRNPTKIIKYILAARTSIKLNSKFARQEYWESVKDSVEIDTEVYDVAISYAGCIGLWNQFVIDKIKAKKKICWMHGDYTKLGTKNELEKLYLEKFDYIVNVSETSKEIFTTENPKLTSKSVVIHNIIDREKIYNYAKSENIYNDGFRGVRFVSVSRLDKEKGFDIAIKAFSKAASEGLNIKWDIIGDGPQKERLQELVSRLDLNNKIRLLGKKTNPYPYFDEADVFFHPSKSEGFGIVIAEAKILEKPILVTAYPTVRDQIEDCVTGKIVGISENEIYDGIVQMAVDTKLRNDLSKNLKGFHMDVKSMDKLLKLIE